MEERIPRNGSKPDKEILPRQGSADEEPEKLQGLKLKRRPDPERMRMLRSLPIEIKQSLTREEADAFLFEDTWPDSLLHKLQAFLVEDKKH